MNRPMCSPWSTGLPQKTCSFADSAISLETGTGPAPGSCSGPPNPTR